MRKEFERSLNTSGSELVESLKLLEIVVLYGLHGAARMAVRKLPSSCIAGSDGVEYTSSGKSAVGRSRILMQCNRQCKRLAPPPNST